jgi:hypothetical protein
MNLKVKQAPSAKRLTFWPTYTSTGLGWILASLNNAWIPQANIWTFAKTHFWTNIRNSDSNFEKYKTLHFRWNVVFTFHLLNMEKTGFTCQNTYIHIFWLFIANNIMICWTETYYSYCKFSEKSFIAMVFPLRYCKFMKITLKISWTSKKGILIGYLLYDLMFHQVSKKKLDLLRIPTGNFWEI